MATPTRPTRGSLPVRNAERWAMRLPGPAMALGPRSVRPIHAGAVARAMLDTLLAGAPGVQILRSAAMQGSAAH